MTELQAASPDALTTLAVGWVLIGGAPACDLLGVAADDSPNLFTSEGVVVELEQHVVLRGLIGDDHGLVRVAGPCWALVGGTRRPGRVQGARASSREGLIHIGVMLLVVRLLLKLVQVDHMRWEASCRLPVAHG